jgi:hypothetical protein
MAISYISGILIGDWACYSLGAYWRRNKINYTLKKNQQTQNISNSFPLLLLFARFTPLIKMPIFIYAGWSKYPLSYYLSWLFLLTALQVGFVSLILHFSPHSPINQFAIIRNSLFIYLILFVLIRTLLFFLKYKKNRKLYFKKYMFHLLRFHNRQFWPLWFLYFPLYFYLLVLAFKYRSIWAWLYVNPNLPNGGWWSEKKSILDGILQKLFKEEYLPGKSFQSQEFLKLNESDRLNFLSGFTFPLVIKPDQGKQGQGVEILTSENQLISYLTQQDDDFFIQNYDSSPYEAGLMFYRDLKTNQIYFFSMTDKFFPQIYGDGKSTILDLILKDPRARFIASLYLDQLKISEDTILPHLQAMRLTQLGNHSKGALFFSDESLMTDPLLIKLNQILGDVKGIDFGRLDIKYQSRENLMKGHFKIMELNGAGAESTNIHDPRLSLFQLYKILFKQWDLLFKLGLPHEKSFYFSFKKLKSML